MALLIDTVTVQREKRYTGLNIQKHANGDNTATITVDTGYYSEFDGIRRWVTETQETIYLSNDQLNAVMTLKHTDLSLTAAKLNLFTFLDTAIYAILSGQIPLTFKYELTVTDTNDNAIKDYLVTLKSKRGVTQSQFALSTNTVTMTGDIIVDAEISIVKDGYEPLVYTLPILRGEVKETKKLSPTPAPTEPTEPSTSE